MYKIIKTQQSGFTPPGAGFTLIETLVAIFILTLSIGALLSLAAGGFYSVRYSRNQIVANNLLQESIEYIRNSRDTSFEQDILWDEWQINVLAVGTDGNPTGNPSSGCLGTNGCYVDPYTTGAKIKECQSGVCPFIYYYPNNAFYGYEGNPYPFPPILGTPPFQTSFVRSIKIAPSGSSTDQLVVTSTISWLNGTIQRSISQQTLITNWRK